MKKLCSMVDFVLAETKLWYGNENESYEIAKSCLKYAQFLKQPLELWTLVPCDEEGNVLEEKMIFSNQDKDYVFEPLEFDKYQKAKSKVLFEVFEFKGEKDYNWIFSHNNNFPLLVIKNQKIEYLSNLVGHKIELTPTATKQFE